MERSGTQAKIEKIESIQDKIVRTIGYKWKSDAREDIDILREKYNIESLITRRKRSLLKIMYKQSLDEINIDNYRPDRILCSRNKVKLKSSFTRITKIQGVRSIEVYTYGTNCLWIYNVNEILKNSNVL